MRPLKLVAPYEREHGWLLLKPPQQLIAKLVEPGHTLVVPSVNNLSELQAAKYADQLDRELPEAFLTYICSAPPQITTDGGGIVYIIPRNVLNAEEVEKCYYWAAATR